MPTDTDYTPPGAFRRVYAGTAVTDANGDAVFSFAPSFGAVPVAVAQVGPSADTALTEARITALTASSCTVNVRRAPAVTLLGIQILAVPQPAVGATVQLIATAAGQGV